MKSVANERSMAIYSLSYATTVIVFTAQCILSIYDRGIHYELMLVRDDQLDFTTAKEMFTKGNLFSKILRLQHRFAALSMSVGRSALGYKKQ